AHDALAPANAGAVEVALERAGDRRGHRQRGAARRVLFESVVRLDDLDVVVVAENAGDLAEQADEQIDAQAHVRRDENAPGPRESFDLLLLLRVEAGRADNDRDIFARGDARVLEGRLRRGELDNHGLIFKQRRERGHDRNPEFADPGDFDG